MDEQVEAFKKKGYVVLKGLLSPDEVGRLKEAVETDPAHIKHEYRRDDGKGLETRVSLWNKLPDTIVGAIARSEKVVGIVEKMLGTEVYHFHSKFLKKDPHTGGAVLWHQDYGYWYDFKCLFPTMGTLWIAIDKADRTNSCVQVIEGSHLVGRVNITKVGVQSISDPERTELLKKRLPLTHVELEPGDAMFFHSNLIHGSDQNLSDKRRWAFLVIYNSVDNIPFGEQPHADYEPLVKVPHSAVMTSPLIAEDGKWDLWAPLS